MLHAQGTKTAIPQVSLITTVLNFGGMFGCLVLPFVAERYGRKRACSAIFSALVVVPTTFFFARETSSRRCSYRR